MCVLIQPFLNYRNSITVCKRRWCDQQSRWANLLEHFLQGRWANSLSFNLAVQCTNRVQVWNTKNCKSLSRLWGTDKASWANSFRCCCFISVLSSLFQSLGITDFSKSCEQEYFFTPFASFSGKWCELQGILPGFTAIYLLRLSGLKQHCG